MTKVTNKNVEKFLKHYKGTITTKQESAIENGLVLTERLEKYAEQALGLRKDLVETKKKRMTAGTVANTQAPVNALCFDTTRLEFFNEKVLLSEDTESPATDSMGEV